METLPELQAQLLAINTAIQRLLAGETLSEFEIGSGSSSRRYKYGEVTLEDLKEEKTRILNAIEVLSEVEPSFRKSSRMQTVYRKV